MVLKVDRFGNLITNLTPEDAPALFTGKTPFKIMVGSKEISEIRNSSPKERREKSSAFSVAWDIWRLWPIAPPLLRSPAQARAPKSASFSPRARRRQGRLTAALFQLLLPSQDPGFGAFRFGFRNHAFF